MAEIKVGDMVWLPTPIRDNPAKTALDEQMLGFEQELTAQPGRVVSIDASGWAMVDRGSFGQFGHHISALRLAQDRQPGLDLGPAIEAGARAAFKATYPDSDWDTASALVSDDVRQVWLTDTRIQVEAALPELRKAIGEEQRAEMLAAIDTVRPGAARSSWSRSFQMGYEEALTRLDALLRPETIQWYCTQCPRDPDTGEDIWHEPHCRDRPDALRWATDIVRGQSRGGE